ncbi:MAG: hypothetical protein U9P70_02715 [Patescibacteria group bacterium]|nr:hypothetical protein [Patescibacteria group bacterium]
MQDFFKSLFIKFEITKGSTALSGLWSQRCSTNIVRLYGELLYKVKFCVNKLLHKVEEY